MIDEYIVPKTILITGSTDGIGLETSKKLAAMGHHILLHGRSDEKLNSVKRSLYDLSCVGSIESYVCDLSRMADVEALAKEVAEKHKRIDVLINNAGIYKTSNPETQDALDVRFVVNTFAPYLLTKRLLPLMETTGRVINISSAAQAPVDHIAMAGQVQLSDGLAYAQSKLALTMWSREIGLSIKGSGPIVVAVNPGSLLASKMVKEVFGVAGSDICIGADILVRAALSEEFVTATGQYFDNDTGQFSSPHPDATDTLKSQNVVNLIEKILMEINPMYSGEPL